MASGADNSARRGPVSHSRKMVSAYLILPADKSGWMDHVSTCGRGDHPHENPQVQNQEERVAKAPSWRATRLNAGPSVCVSMVYATR